MAFRLESEEPLAVGLRRVAHEQLQGSVRALIEGGDERDDDIHSARKSMKRMRGLVRLVRADLGGRCYQQENATYRDAARRLASLRDATVLVATLDHLGAQVDAEAAAAFRPLRDSLAQRRQAAYAAADGRDQVLDEVAAELTAADARVDEWPLTGAWSCLADGIGRVYGRGRQECDEAGWRPTVERLHQWRKRVKYLWYHTQLLNALWPGPLSAWEAELDRLGDLLGDDHDLAVLAETVRQRLGTTDPALAPEAAQALLGHVGDARQDLQAQARILGLRLYGESPRALLRRLRGYWMAWEEERVAGAGSRGPGATGEASVVVQRVADTTCHTGEGPLWHPDEARLYWVDIPAGTLWRHDPASGTHEQVLQAEGAIGGLTLQADGSLLLFLAGGAIAVWRQGQPLQPVVEGIDVERDSRFNDVIADPAGRVFCGTLSTSASGGRLYRLDVDGSLTELIDGVGCSNGMGFTPAGRHLYFIDSPTKKIVRYDYDPDTGELGEGTVFVDSTDDEGVPDGMTVDAEGHVWCARWGGGCLVRYAPDGTEVGRIHLPARKVSSLTFGGADLADLYVTTAGGDDRAAEGEGAGALFRLRPGVPGRPEFRSRVGL